jgi:hypothetical protein
MGPYTLEYFMQQIQSKILVCSSISTFRDSESYLFVLLHNYKDLYIHHHSKGINQVGPFASK